MSYYLVHETPFLRFITSRLGDVILQRKQDGMEVYFQPGDAADEVLTILDENPPDTALHMWFGEYFP